MSDNCQKIKLLKLHEILRTESDEQNPLTTGELLARLADCGISCDRRTLAKDMETLNSQGFEVMVRRVGHQKGYYVEDRGFSLPELKILMDAVQAAGFITERKAEDLSGKIASLGGSHRADLLTRHMLLFNTRKHSNESIYYNVDRLEEAIRERCKVSFRYFDLDENCARVYRKNGEAYVSEPVALILMNDNYYLRCYSPQHESATNYRVDRMDSVEVLSEPVSDTALAIRASVPQYTEHVFGMFSGEAQDVTLEFPRACLGALYDKFGERGIHIRRTEEELYTATVKVQISPTFWGWLFQFEGRMRILSPESAVTACKEQICRLFHNISAED